MKILRADFTHLRNEEWFQFFTEFKDLVQKHSPEKLQISIPFGNFIIYYMQADEALEVIRKSVETEQINEADNKRNVTWRGVKSMAKTYFYHFEEEKQQASKDLMIPIAHYGDMTKKAADEKTASIYNFIQEVRTNFGEQLKKVDMVSWIDELERRNIAYLDLVKVRYTGISSRTKYKMPEVRNETQLIYLGMVERLEALSLLNSSSKIEAFINEWNAYIKHRRDLAAQKRGRKRVEIFTEDELPICNI